MIYFNKTFINIIPPVVSKARLNENSDIKPQYIYLALYLYRDDMNKCVLFELSYHVCVQGSRCL